MPPRRIRLGIMDETPGVSCAGMSLRGQRLLLAAVALTGVLLAGIGLLGVAEGLLFLAPALVLEMRRLNMLREQERLHVLLAEVLFSNHVDAEIHLLGRCLTVQLHHQAAYGFVSDAVRVLY